MKTRTSLVLAIVALALVVFIYAFERRQPTTADLEERSERVLPDFSRDQVDRVVLGEGEDRVELVRVASSEADGGPVGSVGSWRLTHPREDEADQEAVDNLLSALDWLQRRRVVEESGAVARPEFGLAEPRARVSFRLRGRETTLLLGADAPGESMYLAVGGQRDRVLVVDQELLESVTLEAGQLRDKRLARVALPTTRAVRVVGRFHVERETPMRWRLTAPVEMRADTGAVERVVRDLERLRATRFVADDVDEAGLTAFGLDRPSREVVVRLETADEPLVLRFGGECEGHAGEVNATALGSGTVACVRSDALAELEVDPLSLRDMRVARLRASDLERVTVVRGGDEVVLERRGEAWHLEGGDGPEADGEAVEDLLDALREARAEQVETDLEAAGLAGDEPRADAEVRLALVEAEGAGSEILRFAITPARVLARRGTERVALVLPASLAETIRADALAFRARRLLRERADGATEVEVVSAAAPRQLLRRVEGTWRVVEPFDHRADDTIVADLVRDLARLSVERFVALRPAPEHGLARPRITLRARFEQEGSAEGEEDGGGERAEGFRDHRILIGAETEGGSFARLEGSDEPVFVLASEVVESVSAPLVDRDLFAFDEGGVRSLVLERGAERHELTRSGSGWRREGEQVEAAPVDRILTRLAVARASAAVAYGPPAPEMGFDPPRGRLTVEMEVEGGAAAERIVVLVGAERGEGDERRVLARREDVDVTLALPPRTLEPVLEYGAP